MVMAQARRPAASETGDPLLLTPGPLTTTKAIKDAMVHDWGSRDAAFVGINKAVMADPRLKKLMAPDDKMFDGKRMIYGGFKAMFEL